MILHSDRLELAMISLYFQGNFDEFTNIFVFQNSQTSKTQKIRTPTDKQTKPKYKIIKKHKSERERN